MNFHHDAIIRKFSSMPDADKESFAHITKHIFNVQHGNFELLKPTHEGKFPNQVTLPVLYETYDTLPVFLEVKRLLTKIKPYTKLPKSIKPADAEHAGELLTMLNQIVLITLVKRVTHKTQDVRQLTLRLNELDPLIAPSLLTTTSYETLPKLYTGAIYELLESYL
jgi:hypothetical protein